MDDKKVKEIIQLLGKRTEDQLNPLLKPCLTNENAQERANAATDFLLCWLNQKTDEYPLMDDFISSIQGKPKQLVSVIEAMGLLISLKIIKI